MSHLYVLYALTDDGDERFTDPVEVATDEVFDENPEFFEDREKELADEFGYTSFRTVRFRMSKRMSAMTDVDALFPVGQVLAPELDSGEVVVT